jgi:hypothetical protein
MRLLYATPSLPHPLFLSTLPLPCTRSCGPRNQEPFLRPKQPASKTAGWFSLFLSILSSFLLYFTTFGRFRLIMCVHVCICACVHVCMQEIPAGLEKAFSMAQEAVLEEAERLEVSHIFMLYSPLLPPASSILTHSLTHTHTHTHTHTWVCRRRSEWKKRPSTCKQPYAAPCVHGPPRGSMCCYSTCLSTAPASSRDR